jgi:formylglycine-generating enzyme required for sulfatase activity
LPSEAEWEKAARWDPEHRVSRRYPWGDTFEATRCNTSESGIKTTTPVGSYRDEGGVSACGAQDMAGNVWEWTSSFFKPYPYRRDDGREHSRRAPKATESLALHGGSWNNLGRYARAAYRIYNSPVGVSDDIGFRLALTPPGS